METTGRMHAAADRLAGLRDTATEKIAHLRETAGERLSGLRDMGSEKLSGLSESAAGTLSDFRHSVQEEPKSWAGVAGGAMLLLAGLRRGSVLGTLMAFLGGTLAYRSFPTESMRRAASGRQSFGGENTGFAPESGEQSQGTSIGRSSTISSISGEATGVAPESGDRANFARCPTDDVTESSVESFPASDAPSWNAGRE